MDTQDLLALYDLEERILAQPAGMRREETSYVVRHVPPEPRNGYRDGFISYSHLAEHEVAPAIDQQVRFFDWPGLAFEWKVYSHDAPPDLRQRLAAYGFEVEEGEAIMALALDSAPPQLLAPVSHDVPAGGSRPTGRCYGRAAGRVAAGSERAGRRSAGHTQILHPELIAVYAAYAGGQPAASGRLYYDGRSPFASLWGGSTVASYRQQGIYTALLAVRVQEAIRRGPALLF